MSLERLFDPAGIAVVGASRTEGKLGHEAMANLRAFDGPVVPVNPNADGALFDRRIVADVAAATTAADAPIDLAVVCVPPPAVPSVLEDCVAADVGGAVVYSGGFAEAGNEAAQADLRAIAAAGDLTVLGPNTSGFLRPDRGVYASFVGGVTDVAPGSVAVVAQSGGIAHAMAFRARRHGRGVSAMVGLGNRATLDFAAAVEYFDADPTTEAIALHVEGTDDARGLMAACRAATTPVVAYTVGREDVGAFAESHTGALTGDYALYEAGFRQYGVPTVDAAATAFDAGVGLAGPGRPTGDGVGVVTAQAGPGIVMADRLKTAGVTLPAFAPATATALEDHLPDITYTENPVDTGRPSPAFGEVIATVARDPGVDVVAVYELYEPGLGLPTAALEGLAAETGTPIVFATEGDVPAADLAAVREHCTVCLTPEAAADAAAALAIFGRLQDAAVSPPTPESAGDGGAR